METKNSGFPKSMNVSSLFLRLLCLSALLLMGVSCKKSGTAAADNPYGNTGAYFPPAGGSTYGDTATVAPAPAQDYVAPASAPASTASAPTYGSTASSGGGSRSHTVAKGDTLYSLSRRYGTSVSAIQGANGLTSSNIRIGQTLSIP
ncbi:MAG: LysM peptidoglycan-binding domain-containing protein [Akkermansiaceae bacterium]|nr:LysM peptidoglycan-binding domain-containing protein [Verrucomicrobiae bacterium]MCP5552627.1 LysM peptidoglycan-binding domain-containing protein [Akkermansiaceae bacterium]